MEKAGIEKLDYIIASDVIFNTKHLLDFTSCLSHIFNFLKKKPKKGEKFELPTVFLAYKSRHEKIDAAIPGQFERFNFYGEEVKDEEFDPNYKNKVIDIFKFEYDDLS